MPIRRLIEQDAFDPEAIAAMAAAFEATLAELGLVDRSDAMTEIVAKRIIQFAQEGERDPIRLRELALKSLRG
jgi:hypothetical protein